MIGRTVALRLRQRRFCRLISERVSRSFPASKIVGTRMYIYIFALYVHSRGYHPKIRDNLLRPRRIGIGESSACRKCVLKRTSGVFPRIRSTYSRVDELLIRGAPCPRGPRFTPARVPVPYDFPFNVAFSPALLTLGHARRVFQALATLACFICRSQYRRPNILFSFLNSLFFLFFCSTLLARCYQRTVLGSIIEARANFQQLIPILNSSIVIKKVLWGVFTTTSGIYIF